MADPDVKALIKNANEFCAQKGISTESSNKVINIPEIHLPSPDSQKYWIAITVDVLSQNKAPKSEKEEEREIMQRESGVTFNVSTDEEKAEIERLQREAENNATTSS